MTYNIWNKWDPLQNVMLGTCYTSEFFRDIVSVKVRDALCQIADETEEDLAAFHDILVDFGVDVIRPKLDRNDSIMNYVNLDGQIPNRIPRSPLQPRDQQLVVGNDLVYVNENDHSAIKTALDAYNPQHKWINFGGNSKLGGIDRQTVFENTFRVKYDIMSGSDWPGVDSCLSHKFIASSFITKEINQLHQHVNQLVDNYNHNRIGAPSITSVGKDIYIDSYVSDFDIKQHTDIFEDFRINRLTIGGHNDACFHTLKPGVILSLFEIQKYEHTFPNWDVCYLPDAAYNAIPEFMKIRNSVNGKWWVPGQEDNSEFTQFVETWLKDWVGYVEETVFDVNVLVLDEHHVCVNNINNKEVNKFLKKHNMEPVLVPWRHRYFWDGGLHCITLDLNRRGTQQDYFPNRKDAILDLGAVL